MNGFPSQKEVARIKEQYPVGTRTKLISMDDPHAPIEWGMQGTIDKVDAIGTLHMKWDIIEKHLVYFPVKIISK